MLTYRAEMRILYMYTSLAVLCTFGLKILVENIVTYSGHSAKRFDDQELSDLVTSILKELTDATVNDKIDAISTEQNVGLSDAKNVMNQLGSLYPEQNGIRSLGKARIGTEVNVTTLPRKNLNSKFLLSSGEPSARINLSDVLRAPVKSIFYSKTPKTGSTTLRFILYRFAERNSLDICADGISQWHLNFPNEIQLSRVLKARSHCDIIAEEMVFDKVKLSSLSANPENVFYLTSIRHPVSHFLSMFDFLNWKSRVNEYRANHRHLDLLGSITWFLGNSNFSDDLYLASRASLFPDFASMRLSKSNIQLYSMGIREPEQYTQSELAGEIHKKLSEFDFIVNCNYFDESMVILGKLLNWNMTDLLYNKVNVRDHRHIPRLPLHIVSMIEKFHWADMLMYSIANERLRGSIASTVAFDKDLSLYRKQLSHHQFLCDLSNKDRRLKPSYCFDIRKEDWYRKNIKNRLRSRLEADVQEASNYFSTPKDIVRDG